jgi:hypothetical protein
MLARRSILPYFRLTLLLAFWLGGLACRATPWAGSAERREQVKVGHRLTEPGCQITVADLLEQAAVLPAVPYTPAALSGALLPPALSWLSPAWPCALGLLPAVRPCALPDLFRVRLLQVAMAPNAP